MNKLLNVYKPKVFTPLQVINKLKETYPEYREEPIGYAGRLDPLAHGVLLLMIGDATKDRDQYLNLNKSYVFEVLFGFKTDSYDLLGYVDEYQLASNVNSIVNSFVNESLGKQVQSYPPYSSKAVQGKPLFQWAKDGKLGQITIPTHEIEIFDFQVVSQGIITQAELQTKIQSDISMVNGDFRQDEIIKRWHEVLMNTKETEFQAAKFSINCSSGTYIRGLVNELGEKLGCGAVTIDILRTKAGEYIVEDALTELF